jgi:Domain of unknown function (DUF4372)
VPHDNSVFHSILKLVPWDVFDEAVEQHGGTVRPRGFSYKSHLTAMLYAQFAGASSLREIEAGLQSHATRLYHVGARPPRRSSLADANRDRPVAVFSDLLLRMAQKLQTAISSPLAFARLVKANLMHLRRLDQLDQSRSKAVEGLDQAVLCLM